MPRILQGVLLLCLSFGCVCSIYAKDISIQGTFCSLIEIGSIAVDKPAFVKVENVEGHHHLIVSSFKLFGQDSVLRIDNLAKCVESPEETESTTWIQSKKVVWPNNVEPVPSEVMGEGYYSVAGGFLVPGKSNGMIALVNASKAAELHRRLWPEYGKDDRVLSDACIEVVTKPKKNWWYHSVRWNDMDHDGDLDLLTARATKPMIGSPKGEMVWLENCDGPDRWREHFLLTGPDVHFELYDFNDDGVNEIVATEFFSETISLIYEEEGLWIKRSIDNACGKGFDLEFVDLNNDGSPEILATNHQNKADESAVFAYEIPEDFKTGKFNRHTLLTNIPTLQFGVGQASPGIASSFYPETEMCGKPWIVVSGDGSQKAYLLVPASENTDDYAYDSYVIFDAKCTVGKIAVHDVDGDGLLEVFIPAYDKNRIHVMKFQKKQ